MPWLPRVDDLTQAMGYSYMQQKLLVACVLLSLPFGLCLMFWLFYNSWKILIKQGRYRVLPLTTFYILATLQVII